MLAEVDSPPGDGRISGATVNGRASCDRGDSRSAPAAAGAFLSSSLMTFNWETGYMSAYVL